ncbi:MAG: ferrochelatase [Flavobacterium sp.]|jgi:ferrochelatase
MGFTMQTTVGCKDDCDPIPVSRPYISGHQEQARKLSTNYVESIMNNKAVLLVNLGSPDDTDTASVRRYLNQFLMDPYVIQLPWILRRLIVGLFILPFRPKVSAQAYKSIWTEEGSPLIAFSMKLLKVVQSKTSLPVRMAMRYANPSIESQVLDISRIEGIDEIFLVPLYPHYAESTVKTTIVETERVLKKHKLDLTLKVIKPFYEQPGYIESLVKSTEPWIGGDAHYDHILFSYHGLPELHITGTDPTGTHCLKQQDCCSTPSPAHDTCYRHQVLRTTECFVYEAKIQADQYTISFQSRLGRARWLEPSTENTLIKLAESGVKNLLVMCPAFVSDCLETLEEIELQGTETFKAHGGESLTLIPCLNDNPQWVDNLTTWLEAS